jgi:hypothetical protein
MFFDFMLYVVILYVVVFSYFSHIVSGVFTQPFIIYIFKIFSLDFLKIIFILYDIQVLKEKYYKTYIHITT